MSKVLLNDFAIKLRHFHAWWELGGTDSVHWLEVLELKGLWLMLGLRLDVNLWVVVTFHRYWG